MNFLLQHFEKLILGTTLLALLVCLGVVLRNQQETTRQVNDRRENAIEVPEGKIPTIAKDKFQGLALLDAPGMTWSPSPDREAKTLFDPRSYIYCANPECPYILTYDTEICPHCETPQGIKDSREPNDDRNNDQDRDGLPTEYEKQYDFLDDRVAADASRDQDQDLFTNLEEFKSGTDPSDPGSHPPLAEKVRFLNYKKRRLPLELYQVKTYGNADKSKWDLFITVDNDRTKIFSVGDELQKRYTIVEVTHKTKMVYDPTVNIEREQESSVVILKDNTTGATIKLEKGIRPLSTNLLVTFVFLDAPNSLEDSTKIRTKVGEVISLTDTVGNTERYRVQFRARRGNPALQPLDNNDKEKGPAHIIPKFSPERDLRTSRNFPSETNRPPGRFELEPPPSLEF